MNLWIWNLVAYSIQISLLAAIMMLLEELVRLPLWFQPAIWWVLKQIRLSREQLVDRQVIKLTGDSRTYLESLVEIATREKHKSQPAVFFLREHELMARITAVVKEVSMSKTRIVLTTGAAVVLIAAAAVLSVHAFPLYSEPETRQGIQEIKDPIRVGGNILV